MPHSESKKVWFGVGSIAIIALIVLIFKGVSVIDNKKEVYKGGDYFNAIVINGTHYKVKQNLKTYLLLGVDKDGAIDGAPVSGHEQADFLEYLIVDNAKKEYSMLSIPRDSMCKVNMSYGDSYAQYSKVSQICRAHAYGQDETQRVSNTIASVKNLFGGKLNSNNLLTEYFSFTLSAIPSLTDLVGSFDIVLTEDLHPEDLNDGTHTYSVGDIYTITKDTAEAFVRDRSITTKTANLARIARQNAFLKGLMNAVSSSANPWSYDFITSGITNYFSSNINVAELDSILSLTSTYKLKQIPVDGGTYKDAVLTLEGSYSNSTTEMEYTITPSSINDFLINCVYDAA